MPSQSARPPATRVRMWTWTWTFAGVLIASAALPAAVAITTTHHDKPEATQRLQLAHQVRAEDGYAATTPPLANATATGGALEPPERQKRLLPYMTFYLEQDFNRPYGHPPPLAPPSLAPAGYATTGALAVPANVKQPTILQQYHNKFTELTNGISYHPPAAEKTRLTPFSLGNALPGPFIPMRAPIDFELQQQQQQQQQLLQPQVPQPTKPTFAAGANKQPNYSAIYDKLSQLKLQQQQYQLAAQTYAQQQYPPQQAPPALAAHVAHNPGQQPHAHQHHQHHHLHPQHHQPPASYRKPPAGSHSHAPPPLQLQQVSYIPARDFAHAAHPPHSPAKTIVQTYTPSSIDIHAPSGGKEANAEGHNDDDDGGGGGGNAVEDHHLETYNEPVKHYAIRVLPAHLSQHQQQQPQHFGEYHSHKFPIPVEVKKHVLTPVILVRPKAPPPAGGQADKPYLILQRKPPPAAGAHAQHDVALQIPGAINLRPIKYGVPTAVKYRHQHQQHAAGTTAAKHADIAPQYEAKPTLLAHPADGGKPYKFSYRAPPSAPAAPSGLSGLSGPEPIHEVLPQDLPQHAPPPPPVPVTPHPHIISYTRPVHEQGDYVDTEDVKYLKPKYHPTVQLQYADADADAGGGGDGGGVVDEAPVVATQAADLAPPAPVYPHPGRPSPGQHALISHSTTPTPRPLKFVFTPTVPAQIPPASPVKQQHAAAETHPSPEPDYHEGSNSLSLILKKLQDTNALPHTLTPDNIDNSIRTLVKILSGLKKTAKFQRPIVVPDDLAEYEGNNEAGVGLGEVPGTVTQIFPDNTPEGGTPGTPGVDYPALSSIPPTSFNCKTQRYKGFFGDPDTHCQVWHYCDLNGGQASFLCPNGTIFSQVALTCDWWYNVKCSNTAQLYVLNERLYKYILPLAPKFPEDYSGPLVDRYLALKFQEMEDKMKKERTPNKENAPDGDVNAATANAEKESGAAPDDADELRAETDRQEAAQLGVATTASPATHSAPIIVPDEPGENEDNA